MPENRDKYFKHAALDNAKQEIRLLKILPYSTWQRQITCEVGIFELSQAPAYQAASYEWGPEHPARSININGKALSIRRNLWDFLDVLRRREEISDCYFWVDQICIDQTNLRERNHQVQLMSSIYSNAIMVLAWLGARYKSLIYTPHIIALLFWGHKGHKDRRSYEAGKGELKSFPVCRCAACIVESATTRCLYKYKRLDKFFALINRSYWKRLWIIQEVVLAKEVVFCIANQRITKQDLLDFFKNLLSCRQFTSYCDQDGYSSHIEALLSLTRRHDSSIWFIMAIIHGSDHDVKAECTDPRDRVFGLLGMVSLPHRIEADYALSSRELFDQLLECWARDMMQESRHGLNIILKRELKNKGWGMILALTRLGLLLGMSVHWFVLLDIEDIAANYRFADFWRVTGTLGELVLQNALTAFGNCIEDLNRIALEHTQPLNSEPIVVTSETFQSIGQREWNMNHIWVALSDPVVGKRLIDCIRQNRQA